MRFKRYASSIAVVVALSVGSECTRIPYFRFSYAIDSKHQRVGSYTSKRPISIIIGSYSFTRPIQQILGLTPLRGCHNPIFTHGIFSSVDTQNETARTEPA